MHDHRFIIWAAGLMVAGSSIAWAAAAEALGAGPEDAGLTIELGSQPAAVPVPADAGADEEHGKGIYGDDNRKEVFAASPGARVAAAATAALFDRSQLRRQGNGFVLADPQPLFARDFNGVRWCREEPFSEQPSVAYCTGFLVTEDILITAGHCVDPLEHPIDSIYVVFGYQMETNGRARTRFAADDVYRVRELIEQEHNAASDKDWAGVKLSRPVVGRRPLSVSQNEPVTGTELTVIGYPFGLPAKVADRGRILDGKPGTKLFLTNLDTYHGNSGSPVIDSASLNSGAPLVEGILVKGGSDSRPTSRGCHVSVRCSRVAETGMGGNRCIGEFATKINEVVTVEAPAPVAPAPPVPSTPDDACRFLNLPNCSGR